MLLLIDLLAIVVVVLKAVVLHRREQTHYLFSFIFERVEAGVWGNRLTGGLIAAAL